MKLYDLCCGVGGAARGYDYAGFDEIEGFDIVPQPRYPYKFHLEDVLTLDPKDFYDADLIHASFPCQEFTTLVGGSGKYPDLISWGIDFLNQTEKPWVMENVPGAPLRNDLLLCGEMFKLKVIRHRIFMFGNWNNIPYQLPHPPHNPAGAHHPINGKGYYVPVYGTGGGYKGSITEWREAMEIDWTWEKKELSQAVPPRYSWYIGRRYCDQIKKPY